MTNKHEHLLNKCALCHTVHRFFNFFFNSVFLSFFNIASDKKSLQVSSLPVDQK